MLALVACKEEKPKVELSEATAKAISTEMTESTAKLLRDYNLTYTQTGETVGKVDGDGYTIEFPAGKLKLALAGEEEDLGYLELPAYSLHMVPQTADTYTFTSEGYKGLRLLSSEDKLLGEIAIGSADLKGEWRSGTMAYAQYPKIALTWSNIDFKNSTGEKLASLKQFATDSNSTAPKDGKIDRATKLSVEGFALNEEATKARFSIENGKFTYDEKGVNLGAMESLYKNLNLLQEKIVELDRKQSEARMAAFKEASEAAEKAANGTDGATAPSTTGEDKPVADAKSGKPSEAELNEMVDQVLAMFDALAQLSGETTFDGTINNIDFAYKDNTDGVHITLPEMKLSGIGTITDKGVMSSHVGYAHKGFKMVPPPEPEFADYIPSDVALRYGIDNVPLKGLVALVREVHTDWKNAMATKPAGEDAPLPMEMFTDGKYLNRLIALLDDNNTALAVDDVSFTSAALSGSTSGKIEANQKALYKASGSVESLLKGLDALMEKLQASVAKGAAEGASEADKSQASFDQGMMMGLTMVQAMGTPKGDARSYVFELGEDGSLKMNGVDYSGLLQGFTMSRGGSREDSYEADGMSGYEEGDMGEEMPPAIDAAPEAVEPAPAQ